MNIFNRVTLQSMKKSRTRTIVTVIGVVLSAAMITAVAAFAVSLQSYLVNSSSEKYGGWHVEFFDVDSSFAQKQAQDNRVADTVEIHNIGYAMLDGGKNPDKPYLFIAAFTGKAFDTLPLNLISGRLPENSGEILVPSHVAANGGVTFNVGDTLSLAVGSRMCGNEKLGQHVPYRSSDGSAKVREALTDTTNRTYTVVGIFQRPAFEEYAAPGYTLITADATPSVPAPTVAARQKADSLSVFVTLKKPRQVNSYTGSAAEPNGYALNDNVLRFLGLSSDTVFNTLLYSVGSILVVLIMIGSIFLIYNSFNISLNERTRQFGILSSVGATEKQLRNSVLFEGLCIGAAGIPIGLVVGLASIRLVISIIAGNFKNIISSDVPLTLSVSAPALIAAAAVSLITILISAYIPARKAARTPVMENIRQTNEVKVESEAVKTSGLAQRLYGLEGILALKSFRRNKRRYRSIVLSLTLSVVLFVSSSAFGTYLQKTAESSIVDTDFDICFTSRSLEESEMFRLFDEFKAAGGIYEGSYQFISTYTCTVKTSDFSDRCRENASIFSSGEAADESAGEMTSETTIETTGESIGETTGKTTGEAADKTTHDAARKTADLSMDIQFIEDSIYLHFIEDLGLPAAEYTGQNAKMIAAAKVKVNSEKSGQKELVDLFAARSMDFTIVPKAYDNPVRVQSQGVQDRDMRGQSVSITFVDTIPLDTLPKAPSEVKPYVFTAVAPYSLKETFEAPDMQSEMGLTFRSEDPSQSVAQMKAIIQNAGITTDYTLYNLHELFEQNRNIAFVINMFTYIFVAMISLIAIANVFNTISTNIRLRRRELAMIRSVGMSDRSFRRMMNFECVFYGMRTLMFGLPIAAIFSWLIYKGLVLGGADIDFIFPWGSLGISVFGVFFVVFITMLYAVSKIKKENIIDALRDDMT